jgi:hypothetical protein
MGCAQLDVQLRQCGSNVHVFGHSHLPVDTEVEGVRYIQYVPSTPTTAGLLITFSYFLFRLSGMHLYRHALGYPSDWGGNRGAPMCLWGDAQSAKDLTKTKQLRVEEQERLRREEEKKIKDQEKAALQQQAAPPAPPLLSSPVGITVPSSSSSVTASAALRAVVSHASAIAAAATVTATGAAITAESVIHKLEAEKNEREKVRAAELKVGWR